MEEVKDVRMDQREGAGAVLDALMSKIPGFGGYLEREHRREADQRHREFLAKRLTSKKSAIQDVGETLMGSGGLSHLTALDSLTNKIDRLVERTRHASSGFSSFMDKNVVDAARLDRIYEHDLSILEGVEALDPVIENLDNAADSNDKVAQAIKKVKKALDELDGRLDTRDKILKGLE